MLDAAFKEFESGGKDIDLTYTIETGSLKIQGFSLHDPYVWDNEKEPVFFSYNHQNKTMRVSNLSNSDLRDGTIMQFLGLDPEEIV